MALFYQHNINETTRLGIWHIEEPAEFFLEKVPLQRNITHPHKRLQHLAARWLLQHLFPDFPYHEILVADTRKPYLPGEQYHFSISHTGDYAAAIVSSQQRVGLDIERLSPKIDAIAHKFLHERDIIFMQAAKLDGMPYKNLVAFMWGAKECLYKWHGMGGIDFKQHLQLTGPPVKTTGSCIQMPFAFKKDEYFPVNVAGQFFTDIQLVLGWVVT